MNSQVFLLAELGIDKVITLLCIEDSPKFCHRRLLAEECSKYFSELEIIIN